MSETITAAGTGFAGGGREWLLAMDTSTAHLTVALLDGPNPAAEWNALGERNHSVRLIPAIQELAASAGVKMRDLRAVAVGRGPGSYTGVRIGVTAGKTLAWSLGVPLIGVSSLEALALGAAREARGHQSPRNGAIRIVPLMDARRGQVYTALFESGGSGGWRRLTGDGIRLMREWADELAERAENGCGRETAGLDATSPQAASGAGTPAAIGPAGLPDLIRFVGDPSLHLASIEQLKERLDGRARVEVRPTVMEGRFVAELGIRRLAAGEADDPHALVPNYTQLAEAEAKLLAGRQEG